MSWLSLKALQPSVYQQLYQPSYREDSIAENPAIFSGQVYSSQVADQRKLLLILIRLTLLRSDDKQASLKRRATGLLTYSARFRRDQFSHLSL